MIVTLTANPSLDRTVTLSDALRVGEVQSALSVREDAGGKGINVTRVLAGSGVATRAVLPLDADDPFAAVLRSAHVPVLAVPLPGPPAPT
jgi:1-phosphofructokinase